MATIAKTGCGKFVFDRYGSHIDIATNVLKDALFKLQIPQGINYTYTSVRLPYQAGYNIVVPAEEGEEIFYAKRSGNKFLSRFVVKNPIPTKYVSLELKKLEKVENEWLLLSSHLGDKRYPEIDLTEGIGPMEEDLAFWNSHAFCWGYAAVVPGTITQDCPWEP
jgi:hypothetical protein